MGLIRPLMYGHNVPDAVKVNPRVSQLSHFKSFPNSMTFTFSLAEAQGLDRAISELVQAQSFSFWLLSAFLLFLQQEDFQPSSKSLFDKFTNVISSITQAQSEWTLSIQAVLTLLGRKSLLNRLLPSVLQHQKDGLLKSPVFGDSLFNPETL